MSQKFPGREGETEASMSSSRQAPDIGGVSWMVR
jgi:hypothetical protein